MSDSPDWLGSILDQAFQRAGVPPPTPSTNGHANGYHATRDPDAHGIAIPDAPPWPDPPHPAAYHGLAGEIVRLIEPQTESDPVAILSQFLVMFGSAIGRKAHWKVEETRHYGNLYLCLVGETAKGRKGTSKDRALRCFEGLEDGWQKRIYTGLSSGEGLIHAVRDPTYQRQPIKEGGRTIDYEEVMTDGGVEDKRILVVEPEFGRVLKVMEREGNTLSARLREGWDDGNMRGMTKTAQVATGAHVSIIGHITRIELVKGLSDVEAGNGTANRILWCAVRRSKLLPLGGESVDLGSRDDKVLYAIERARETDTVPFDGQARELWADSIYPRLTAGGPGLLGAVTNRAEAQTRRLAMLYALLDFSPVVTPAHLLAALALWDYSARSCKWIFGSSTGDEVADEILIHLEGAGQDGLTLTQLRDLFGRHEKGGRIGRALSLLVELGLILVETEATGGRPTQRVKVADGATKATKATKAAPQGLTSEESRDQTRPKGGRGGP